MNSRREIWTRFTNDTCLVVNGNTQFTEWHVDDQLEHAIQILSNFDQSGF